MSDRESFEVRAKASFKSEMGDVREACAILDTSNDPETAYEQVQELCGEPLEVVRHGSPVKRIEVLLSWGGPASGYVLKIERGMALSGYYWYQDWNTGKRQFPLDDDELEGVITAYNLYLGE